MDRGFKTTLYHLKVIGELTTVRKLPYYILSGIGCHECDANVSIYIHSPSNGPMKNEAEQKRFDYPGRELSTLYKIASSFIRAGCFWVTASPGIPTP